MDNVVSLKNKRILLESAQDLNRIREIAQEGLDKILCADVSKFDGRLLRKTRDHILQFRHTIIVSSPEAQKLVEARLRTLNLDRPLSEDERSDIALEVLAPLLSQLTVRFA